MFDMFFLFYVMMIFGFCGVCCNPAPYLGVVFLVVSSVVGCALLGVYGNMFISLILFIVYLGGMMVVFAYSVAMTVEFNDSGVSGVLFWFVIYFFGSFVVWWVLGPRFFYVGPLIEDIGGHDLIFSPSGVSLMYVFGCVMLSCVFGLFMTLFVVFELVRGSSRFCLRPV